MNEQRFLAGVSRSTLFIIIAIAVSVLVEVIWGDPEPRNLTGFLIALLICSILYVPMLFVRSGFEQQMKRSRYQTTVATFLYLVVLGSIPFFASGKFDPVSALFESMAGFSTTGVSTVSPEDLLDVGPGLLFFRCAIQWMGGLFYLVVAFMFLSELSNLGHVSAERRIFSNIGFIPNLSNLMLNLTAVYAALTIGASVAFILSGMPVFDSICLSMGTVSTGGYSASGHSVGGGPALHMIVLVFMFLSGIGFYLYISLISGRSVGRRYLDPETLVYFAICLIGPASIIAILLIDGMGVDESIWKGAFASVAATSTTGFLVKGIDGWPDPARFLLLLLMLIGGSSFSVTSGFKVQKLMLLWKGLKGYLDRTAHPNAVVTVGKGERTVSSKALEAASISFFYIFGLLAVTMMVMLIFYDDIFEVLSLCTSAISNSGMIFGGLSDPSRISSMNALVKISLMLAMMLGRMEILLPLYVLSPRSHTFKD